MHRKILPIVVVIFMVGCVELEVQTTFDSKGSGVQIWRFTSSALIAAQVKNFVDSHPLLKNGKRIWDEYRKGEYLLGLEVPFNNPSEIEDQNRQVAFETKGWIHQTSTYTETWKESLGQIGPLQQTGSFLPIKVRWQVTMPGKILNSNADQVEGNTAVWNLTLTDLGSSRTFTAQSVSWNGPIIVGLGLVGISTILITLFAVRNRIVRERATCRYCGTAILKDAAFCSVCGKSQKDGL